MKYIMLLFMLFCFKTTWAQEDVGFKHVISTTPFKLENNSQTFFRKLNPKNYTSLDYERLFNKWSWSTSIEYATTKINDDCNTCADHFYGTGYLQEFNFFTGMNYRLIGKAASKIHLFIGTDLYYSKVNYSGDFEGGYIGGGISRNDNYDSFGLRQRLGVHCYPISRLRLSLTTSARMGFSWKKETGNQETTRFVENSESLPELKIGFLF